MNIFIIVILYLIILPTFLFSQNKWIEVFQGIGNPQAIKCLDETNCYILNYGSPTRLYQSQDGGDTWILLNEIKELEVQDISVPDNSHIFVSFNKSILYNSYDGGATFESTLIEGIYTIKYIEMFDLNIGVLANQSILLTRDRWKTNSDFKIEIDNMSFAYHYPNFINDSILYTIVRVYDERVEPQNKEPPIDKPRITGHVNHSLMKLNINTLEYELIYIDHLSGIRDFFVLNELNLFVCGTSTTLSGGSCHDAVYKSTDSGVTWRRVLDLYSDRTKFIDHDVPPFGLQSIAFKDSLTGIAVGQFGKIVYTYDGGESWTYESELPYKLGGVRTPPVMKIRYAGEKAIITEFSGSFHRLQEDNLVPGLEHKYSISGRVWEGDKGQIGIPISLDTFRITMTDKDGYYRFGNLKEGNYQVRALNKYFDDANPTYYYKPFDYTPLEYNIELTSDTTGFDFNAEDLRTFYKVEGYIVDDKGQGIPDIFLRTGSSTTTTDESGRFEFPKIESRLTFDVIPYSEELAFSPSSHRINLITGDTTDLIFTATPATSVWESKPAPETIFISDGELFIPNPDFGATLVITDVLGRQLLNIPLAEKHDISNLHTGIYFATITKSDTILKIYKIVVDR
jgi:hypothetical protein